MGSRSVVSPCHGHPRHEPHVVFVDDGKRHDLRCRLDAEFVKDRHDRGDERVALRVPREHLTHRARRLDARHRLESTDHLALALTAEGRAVRDDEVGRVAERFRQGRRERVRVCAAHPFGVGIIAGQRPGVVRAAERFIAQLAGRRDARRVGGHERLERVVFDLPDTVFACAWLPADVDRHVAEPHVLAVAHAHAEYVLVPRRCRRTESAPDPVGKQIQLLTQPGFRVERVREPTTILLPRTGC